VVLVDVEAGRPRLELMLSLARANPDARILALGNSSEAGAVEEVFRAGASGYVLRSADDDELWQAVEAVHRGETYLTASGRELMRHYLTRRSLGPRRGRPLTAREREVLKLVADGLSNKEIAARLRISVRTVENHRASIMRKLDLKSVVDLVKYAIACGLTQIEEG
jgi:DNA-binding NarL/FixJ family response regulator